MPSHFTKLLHSLLSEHRAYQLCPWQPLADVYRGSNEWLIKFDLAGVRIEDVELRVNGRRLIIQGLRRDRSILEGHQAYSMEIAYNRFQRVVELPCDIEQADIVTEYDNGMLLVRLALGS